MAVIGSKGTYAQVQAPKDYLGNALSNVEQMNFKYREERRQQEELKLAREAAAEKERLARQDKAQEEASKLKAENTGDNRLNVSMQNLVAQKANRYAELKSKTNLTAEERSELDEIPRLVDRLKFTAQNFKSFLDTTVKDIGEDKINLDLLEDGTDILGSIYNLKRGAVILDDKGNAMLELVDPDNPSKKIIEPIDKFGDIGYLQSLVPRKQKIIGKDGLVESLKANLEPVENKYDKNGFKITKREITPEQKEAAMQTIESFVSNDMKLKDAAQQLKLNYRWKDDAEKEKVKQDVKNIIYNQALSGKKIGEEKERDYQAITTDLAQRKFNYDVSRDAIKDAKEAKEEQTINPIKIQRIAKGGYYNGIKVKNGDSVATVNPVPKAKIQTLGSVLKKDENGRQIIEFTVTQKTTEDKYDSYGELIAEGKTETKTYNSKDHPQQVNNIVRTSIVDDNGNPYVDAKDYASKTFGGGAKINARKTANTTTPKSKTTPKATETKKAKKTIKGF